MARPSRNSDQLLLTAGAALLRESGIAGISVRRVCERAGVNLGMFTYHFHTKENFLRQLLAEAYEDFFRQIVAGADPADPPLRRLISLVERAVEFIEANRALSQALFKDGIRGTPLVAELVSTHFSRHLKIVFRLIEDCQREGILRGDAAPEHLLITLGSAVILPMFWSRELCDCIDPSGAFIPFEVRGGLNSSAHARTRLMLFIEGLGPRPKKIDEEESTHDR